MKRTAIVLTITVLGLPLLAGCVASIGLSYDPDPELYPEPPHDAITFWGHSCSYIDIEGTGIVVDPVFEPAYATFHKRFVPSPPPSAYDQTKVVLISHPHNDHLSMRTLRRFPDSTLILCPVRSAKYLDEATQQILTMRPGDVYTIGDIEIIAVTMLHPGYRYSLKVRADGRALGFVIRTPERTILYSGDSDYFEGFAEIGNTYRPSLVILNVTTHLRTKDAIKAIRDLNVRKVVPSHYGAYSGSNERKTPEYREELADLLGSIWVPLAVGESCTLDGEPLD
jgi:L-ascorbate metabolism protein UlaG (beta-lactamase superfamily)